MSLRGCGTMTTHRDFGWTNLWCDPRVDFNSKPSLLSRRMISRLSRNMNSPGLQLLCCGAHASRDGETTKSPHNTRINGILEEVEAVALKRVIAWQLAEIMRAKKISKKTMADRMHTSRSQLD